MRRLTGYIYTVHSSFPPTSPVNRDYCTLKKTDNNIFYDKFALQLQMQDSVEFILVYWVMKVVNS